ncbi:MAG: hypothetical protein FJW26_04490 [Acidimicrobiia bacterium]|nr:hypothetical protein [Acidimicrobiia bacterium]
MQSGGEPKPPAISAVSDVRQTLYALRDRLWRISQKLTAIDARRMAASATADVNELVRSWTPTATVSSDYVASLHLSLESLDLALQSKQEGPAFLALQAAADDLRIKADHCRKAGVGLGGMVTVIVRTRKGQREQRNLQVLYLPKLTEVVKETEPSQFPSFSSPTSHTLPPGRYLMWTREPQSQMMGARSMVRIGDGRKTVEWELPVP